jgi:predicted RNase H-like nuclease (RuvC/YqgF family)
MEKFADEIRSLEVLIDRKQREHEALDRENKQVQADLEEYKLKDSKYSQVRISLEQET